MVASKFTPKAEQREGRGYRYTAYIGVRNGWGEDTPFGLSRSDRRHHLSIIGKLGPAKQRSCEISSLMATAPLRILPTPEALGEELADRILQRIEEARVGGRPFVLGSPTGRTPRPIYAAMARRLAAHPQDLSHVTVVMMDEYLVPVANGLAYAPAEEPWSCHYFARVEIAAPLNAVLRPEHRLNDARIWFPTPNDSGAYDDRIADAGGIDIFLLASGATDGHVAFNPPGSPRDSRTRVIPLSEATRRDNLRTFPAFGSLDRVPRHGVSVGISTIVSAREALMVVWGSGKGLTLSSMLAAERYQPDWPATLVHECRRGEIIADEAAASASRIA